MHWIDFDPSGDLKLFGIRLVGANPHTGKKLLFTLLLILLVVALNFLLRGLSRLIMSGRENDRLRWTRQGLRLFVTVLLLFGLISIWFSDPGRLGTAAGFVTASSTYDIVGLPPIKFESMPPRTTP